MPLRTTDPTSLYRRRRRRLICPAGLDENLGLQAQTALHVCARSGSRPSATGSEEPRTGSAAPKRRAVTPEPRSQPAEEEMTGRSRSTMAAHNAATIRRIGTPAFNVLLAQLGHAAGVRTPRWRAIAWISPPRPQRRAHPGTWCHHEALRTGTYPARLAICSWLRKINQPAQHGARSAMRPSSAELLCRRAERTTRNRRSRRPSARSRRGIAGHAAVDDPAGRFRAPEEHVDRRPRCYLGRQPLRGATARCGIPRGEPSSSVGQPRRWPPDSDRDGRRRIQRPTGAHRLERTGASRPGEDAH